MPHSEPTIETRSLAVGKWANLFMAVAGVAGAYFSRSDALLVDGLYSGVNFVSAIVAARVGAAVMKPADQRFPFGYEVLEALYVKYRALILLGIMALAVFGAVQNIITYATGGQIPKLVFGPILVYSVVMVATCFGLAGWHDYNWARSGRHSVLLQTESKAAVVDGVISAGAGGGLLAASLLNGTALGFIVPVADSVVVLMLSVLLLRQPVVMFLDALREVAGQSAEPAAVEQARKRTQEVLTGKPFHLLEVTVLKVGRRHVVAPFLKPQTSATGEEIDAIWLELEESYRKLFGDAKAVVIVTATQPYGQPPTPRTASPPVNTSEAR